jgi:DNA-binding CsgD family transcriptional regulator
MKNGYKSENFRYMRPHLLVEQLDYLILKERLLETVRCAEDRNPFGAGRPERFTPREKQHMALMKQEGKTFREIAEYYECSTSLVHKAIEEVRKSIVRK